MSKQDLYLALGDQLKEARAKLNLTLEELAEQSGLELSRSAISSIEQGKQQVYLHQFLSLLHALHLRPEQVVSDLLKTLSSNETVTKLEEMSPKNRSAIDDV